MDKKQMKAIHITDMQINTLYSSSDPSGEYTTHCSVDFFLSESISFDVFNKTYVIDRINMGNVWDEIVLQYGQEGKTYCCFPVAKTFIHKIMNRVTEEQRNGDLKGWIFDDELMEILQGENTSPSCYY